MAGRRQEGPLEWEGGGVKKEAQKKAGTEGPAATNKKKERGKSRMSGGGSGRSSSSGSSGGGGGGGGEGRACSGIGQVDVSASVSVRPSAESHSGVWTLRSAIVAG